MARPRKNDREERVPLGSLRLKLKIPDGLIDEKRFQPRWVVDRPGRLPAAEAGGYTFVQDPNMEVTVGEGTDGRNKMSTSICRQVGTHEGGKPMMAYLMKIRRDWYERDQAEKQKVNDETDKAIQAGRINSQPGDMRYIGAQGISYKP